MKVMKDVQEKYKIRPFMDMDDEMDRAGLKKSLWFIFGLYLIKYKQKLFERLVKIMSFFTRMMPLINFKAFLKPHYKYEMDGRFLFMNRLEKNPLMRNILEDYRLQKIWEPETTKIVKEKVKRGDICLDIGASIGYFTLLFSSLVGPIGKVVAVEPTSFQIPYLKKNIEINDYNDRAIVEECAAWDKTEMVSVPLNSERRNQTHLQGKTIDDIVENYGLRKVDFIKIDTDGSEPWIIKGMIKTVERNPNLKMVIEYYPQYVYDAGGNMKEFDDFLNKYFKCQIITNEYDKKHYNLYCERL